jgi:hypothetical protein
METRLAGLPLSWCGSPPVGRCYTPGRNLDRSVIYLPMSFASGLFIPVAQLPAVGAPTESMVSAVIWLAIWTVLLFGLALRFIRRDQNRKFS